MKENIEKVLARLMSGKSTAVCILEEADDELWSIFPTSPRTAFLPSVLCPFIWLGVGERGGKRISRRIRSVVFFLLWAQVFFPP
jgi:hypothetical protein